MQIAQLIVIDFIEKTGSDFIRYATETNIKKMDNRNRRHNRGKSPKQIRTDHSTYGRVYVDDELWIDLYLLEPDAEALVQDVLLTRALGLVYVVDCNDEDAFPAIASKIGELRKHKEVPILIASTGRHATSPLSMDVFNALKLTDEAILRDCDITDVDDVSSAILILMLAIVEDMEAD